MGFCGDSSFSPVIKDGDFSPCFYNPIIYGGVPILIGFVGYLLPKKAPTSLIEETDRGTRFTKIDRIRLISSAINAVLPLIFMLLRYIWTSPGHYGILSASLLLFSWTVATFILRHETLFGHPNARYLRAFWFTSFVVASVKFRGTIRAFSIETKVTDNYYVFITDILIFFSFFIIMLTGVFMKGGSKRKVRLLAPQEAEDPVELQPSPELKAGVFSHIFFNWMSRVMKKGFKQKYLKLNDLYMTHPTDNATLMDKKFKKAWLDEQTRVNRINERNRQKKQQSTDTSNDGSNLEFHAIDDMQEMENLDGGAKTKEENTPRGSLLHSKDTDSKSSELQPSLYRVLFNGFMYLFAAAGLYKLVYDALIFVGPLMLRYIIGFLQDRTKPDYEGYIYCAILFTSASIQSVILHQYFHQGFRTGLRIRSALVTAIYQKSLRLTPNARAKRRTGEIVNLMSTDSKRIQDILAYLHIFWSSLFQIALSLYFLQEQMGVSILAGVGVMIVTIPLSAFVAKKMKAAQSELMKIKDIRIKITNESMSAMKIIKLYAWEPSFRNKINNIREDELKQLKKYVLLDVLSMMTWTVVPMLVSLVTFSVYTAIGEDLSAEKAFTALTLFSILQFPLAILPRMIGMLAQMRVSVERIRSFLCEDELTNTRLIKAGNSRSDDEDITFEASVVSNDMSQIQVTLDQSAADGIHDNDAIVFDNATFCWDRTKQNIALKDISVAVRHGELMAVVGSTGCGKSALLSAIIGDLQPCVGGVELKGASIAYSAQVPWIQNATLRDNILFGRAFDQQWYWKVVHACALAPDIQILPAGDFTEIGEKGINLSGGQMARVALARAVYQDSDIYLLDDCLSAVDSHVGLHIFQHCIKGILAKKPVVLVTHALNFLPSVDQVLLIRDKTVFAKGTYQQLLDQGIDFAALAPKHKEEEEAKEDIQEEHKDGEQPAPDFSLNKAFTKSETNIDSRKSVEVKMKKAGELMKEEDRVLGDVSLDIYKSYYHASGGARFFIPLVFSIFCFTSFTVGASRWLAYWSQERQNPNESRPAHYFLGIYAILMVCGLSFSAAAILTKAFASLQASRVFHSRLVDAIFRAPMHFFDETPLGRILNRFSKDMFVIDETLSHAIYSNLRQFMHILGIVFVIALVTPEFLLAVVPLALFYYNTQRFYIQTSREVQRWNSVLQSPIFSHFTESLDGDTSIRAFQAEGRFIKENETRLNLQQRAYYMTISCNRWLAMRLEFVGTFIVTAASLFAVINRDIDPSLGGLSISYALTVTQSLNWMVRMVSEREQNIVSVERVQEYAEVTPEAALVVNDNRPDKGWPAKGHIKIDNLAMRYRPHLPTVLSDFSVEIKPQEKIGVVGRTGAGKSSLLLALLRLVEPDSKSRIFIDDVDVATIGLQDLRSKLTIIPQQPILFTGTVRFNLDPFDESSDKQLWGALEMAYLAEHIRSLPKMLDYEIEEGGKNFSVGQRQLICMARALLRKSRVLLLDEATSAVDVNTDSLIQKTIRAQFADCSVLTIAHRVNTILDSDRIFVLDDGKLVEAASPDELLADPNSVFSSILEDFNKHSR